MPKNTKFILTRRATSQTYARLLFSTFALILVTSFAVWWFSLLHVPQNFQGWWRLVDIFLFLLVSYVIWHPIVMEVLTWCIASHIRDVPTQKPVPGMKVAFITTIVPKNEPIELLHKCLPAMVRAKYKHDTWLLDEGNDEEVKLVCAKYNVYYFSRFGKTEFNTPNGKYTKTKGGNHNSWYDTFGNNYDFVAQIDTDFVPKSTFLAKTLGYFRDPKVAFVGTPQIYGNTNNSFIALGANEQQFTFYGAVLRGLSGMGMSLLIGANHIIRVSAFKNVGHYTAHITEDLVTGMKLHAHGWKSMYLPDALAVGEGPNTWESYFNQQLRWAYGCIDILFHHSFGHFKKMDFRQIVYYFFLQQHYFSGVAQGVSILLLSLFFLFGIRTSNVDSFQFFIFYSSVLLVCWLMSVWLLRYSIFRKDNDQLLLAGKVVSIAAWPIWFMGLISVITGKRLNYKVTPKGETEKAAKISPLVFTPHFIFAGIAILGIITSFFTHQQSIVMVFWALSAAVVMLTVPFIEKLAYIWKSAYSKFKYYFKRVFDIHGNISTAVGDRGIHSFASTNERKVEMFFDCLFLFIIVFTSSALYINKLGFYSDDWSFLGNFSLSHDQSFIGLFRTATTPNTLMRPLQNIYDVFLFWLFGTRPLGYHMVNFVVFSSIIILFYAIMRRLQIHRIIAITVPLVFALLPNYSTDRFWYAAFQVNICMLFFLLSTYTGLNIFSASSAKKFFWETVSILFLILSGLSYEIAMPLVLINMILFRNPGKRFGISKKYISENNAVFIVVNCIVLFYLFIFKAKTTTRLESFSYPGDAIHLIVSVFHTNFIELGLKLPFIWRDIFTKYTNENVFIIAALVFLFIFFYLVSIVYHRRVKLPSSLFMRNLTLVSVIIFILGYAIFFTNNKVGFSPTGIDNRVAIGASIGIAFLVVGIFGWLSRVLLPEKLSKYAFCFLIAISCTSGFLVINTLASFWSSAYRNGQSVLTGIYTNVPTLPQDSVILLDGVCPYQGPGVVFEAEWDLKGALQTLYKDPTLRADIVTPRLKVTSKTIDTQIYNFKTHYPYKNLYIYNYNYKRLVPIADSTEAFAYFSEYNPDYNNNCPPAIAGNGVSVF